MKSPVVFAALAAFAAVAAPASAPAQVSPAATVPARAAQSTEEEVVTLNPFEVSSSAPARYQSAAAAAGGRIAADVMSTPTTVTVLTQEFISDVGGSRVLDVAKYVAGVGEARLPSAQDRLAIRGFEITGRRVDGFSSADLANYDHGGIERLEVVKGPDALLHPSGAPGGTINLVTKKPQFTPGGSVKVQVGEYNTNRAELDVTGPLSQSFAYRAVVAAQDSDGYVSRHSRRSLLITPSLTWRLAPQSNLTLRYEYYDFKATNDVGLPADPSVGTGMPVRIWEGLPRTFNPTYGRNSEFRKAEANSATLLFTSTVTDQLSVRLAGRLSEVSQPYGESRVRTRYETPVPAGWTNINPRTGEYVPGMLFDPNPPYAPIPAPAVSPIFELSGTDGVHRHVRNRDLQNDWSYIVEADRAKSTTLLGFAYAYSGITSDERARTVPSIDTRTEHYPSGDITFSPINSMRREAQSRYQIYLTEQLELFDSRLVLSGGVSHVTFNGYYGNKLWEATPTRTAGHMFPGSGSKATYNYGVVLKPLAGISLYYGHTENAVPVGNFAQVSLGLAPTFSIGEQDEVGIKGSFFEGRVIASVAYYEIEQSGYGIYNPGNFANPPPATLLPDIFVSREAKGWEFQVTGSLTPNLSVIASYTDATSRDPNGNMLASVPEMMANAYLRYELGRGPLKGLAVAVGATYMGTSPIENVSGYTPASTPDNLIPIRPSGYLPARTITDVTLSYERANWSYSLTVANALDKEYWAAADFRNLIVPGTPRNIYGSVSWKF
ncbi:hypothetical protein AXK11_02180 [Cephaloticoccus primus]|uniref:TonB-dependent receptor plug domain-containing protein n=1 Tax=Cephaloticoccus primus TaxID=1548207 RepID=A0A139SSK9_9BACT|nr:TonB-dependent receptor [Cephaloticoccus primus]KXU37524.1 hypothetical protein AXK11_02180 [Cephaloticoccus primus]